MKSQEILAKLKRAVDAGETKLFLNWRAADFEGVKALAESPYLSNLTYLDLAGNRMGPEGAKALAESHYLSNLTTLDLSCNEIGSEGAKALAESPYLSNLTTLDLAGNRMGPKGAKALAESHYLSNLTSLHLYSNEILDEGAKALAESPYLSNLTTLDLWSNQIGDEGAKAIAESPYLSNLTSLHLWSNQIGFERAKAIEARLQLNDLTGQISEHLPVLHKTILLAKMIKQDKDLDVLDSFRPFLSTKEHPALSLWALRLIQSWDVAEYFLNELQNNTYKREPWVGLQSKLLERGLNIDRHIKNMSKEMEDHLLYG